MAQYYLINVAMVGAVKYLPGAFIDSDIVDATAITNAGGELWPASDATVAAAALKAQAAHRYKGANELDLIEIMQVAVNVSTGITVLPATSTTAGLESAAQFNFLAGLAGTRAVRGVVTANVADLTAFTVAGNDGLTYVAGQRVLLVGQSTGAQSGIYVVGTVATGTAPLTRALDFAAGAAIVNGMPVEVSEGTKWSGSTWKAFCTGACVVATDDPLFYPRVDKGHGALATGTPSVLTVSNMFIWTGAEVTADNQTTAANGVKAVQSAGRGTGSLVITGPNTVTDTISYAAINF